jgi:hypothetical protein
VIIGNKILFASILALSAATSAYAAEEDTLIERETSMSTAALSQQHVAANHVRAHRATEARAYAPAGVPADEAVDFGIGSQR